MDGASITRFRGDTAGLPSRVDLASMLTPEHFELEREKIFRRAWMPILHTADVPLPGSYHVYELPTLKTSLLVVRGADGVVRAFHNVCRHRGNKLVRSGSGNARSFWCNFHGWTYSPEGELKLVTDEHQFDALDKSKLGLVPVATEVWEDFIFVNFDPRPGETLAQWLGVLHGQYEGYFETHELVASNRVVLNCNWHLGVNSFTEGYHTQYLHRNSARDYQGGKSNPERHRPYLELCGRHHRFSAPGNPDHQILDVEGVAIRHGRKILPAFDFDCSALPAGVNPSRFDNWGFDNVALFPNFVMLTGNHWRAELWFWPIDAGRTLVLNRAYNYRPKNLGERLSQAYFRSRGRDVVREDLNTLEAQQEMLASGALSEIILSRQETSLKHHYRVTQSMLAAA
jgi:Rieske 2Fe-2S family protein